MDAQRESKEAALPQGVFLPQRLDQGWGAAQEGVLIWQGRGPGFYSSTEKNENKRIIGHGFVWEEQHSS